MQYPLRTVLHLLYLTGTCLIKRVYMYYRITVLPVPLLIYFCIYVLPVRDALLPVPGILY